MANTSDIVDIIRQNVSIVDEISQHVQLKQKNSDYLGLCPFHSEKTPSFTVSPRKGFFYCFGCHAKGDVISFLMQLKSIGFLHAVELLAKAHNIPLPSVQKNDNKYTELGHQLFRQLVMCAKKDLLDAAHVLQYLRSRGLDQQTINYFHIGYCGKRYQQAVNVLTPDEKQTAHAIGLFSQSGRSLFQGRIVFPIQHANGKVIALGSRSVNDTLPKYLNSPESFLFHKKKTLYGMYQFKKQTGSKLLVVEGYMDVVALYQVGIIYAVASLGTAFTAFHFNAIRHYASDIYFCFDGDKAGRAAQWSAIKALAPKLHTKMRVYVMELPEGEDPDSYVRKHGKNGFDALLAAARTWDDYFFEFLVRGSNIKQKSIQERSQAYEAGAALILSMENVALRETMMQELKSRLGLLASVETNKQNESKTSLQNALSEQEPTTHPAKGKSSCTKVKNLVKQLLTMLMRKNEVSWQPALLPENPNHRSDIRLLRFMLDQLMQDPSLLGKYLLASVQGKKCYPMLSSWSQEDVVFCSESATWMLKKLQIILLNEQIQTMMHLRVQDDAGLKLALQELIQAKKTLESSLGGANDGS